MCGIIMVFVVLVLSIIGKIMSKADQQDSIRTFTSEEESNQISSVPTIAELDDKEDSQTLEESENVQVTSAPDLITETTSNPTVTSAPDSTVESTSNLTVTTKPDSTTETTSNPTITAKPTDSSLDTSASQETKKIVAIDAGHQKKGDSDTEPNGPGSTVMKAKVTQGATGVSTGVTEYQLNLDVAMKLKEELLSRGYEVVMIRESNDVDLSNAQRAAIANESADIFIRIHANGSEDSSVSGALTIYPSENNEYVGYMSEDCKKLSEEVIDAMCEATGAENDGAIVMDNMSGINWCTIPVTIIEMGYLSNPAEDKLMQTEDYQNKIATGIANGIDTYFAP